MPNVILQWRRSPKDRRDETIEIAAPEGGSLGDLSDDHGLPIPFSCRSANCGTCRIDVLEGWSELQPAEKIECDVLALFDAAPTHRLACCVTMKAGLAMLRIRPVDDDVIAP